jgi:hypothetical protein
MLGSHGGGDRRTCSVATMAKRAAMAQSSGGGRRRPGGPLLAAWLGSHPGWCKAFGPGWTKRLRWTKRLDGLGAMVGSMMKKLEKRKVNGWAAKDTWPN